jgi:hypothetical protein
MNRPTRRIALSALLLVGLSANFIAVGGALAFWWEDEFSFDGCTTELWSNGFNGTPDYISAAHDDANGCATKVAVKYHVYANGSMIDDGWVIGANFAYADLEHPAIVFAYSRYQMEVGTDDWSGFAFGEQFFY